MNHDTIQERMLQLNGLYKEMDDVYHSLAKHYGLSDTALWILCVLRESPGVLTQGMLCNKLSLRKQTINSALKNLEQAGYVTLESSVENRKNKQIHFTPLGEDLARRTADHVLTMEQCAFQQLSDREQDLLLQLNQTYVTLLQREAEKLLTAPRENV